MAGRMEGMADGVVCGQDGGYGGDDGMSLISSALQHGYLALCRLHRHFGSYRRNGSTMKVDVRWGRKQHLAD